MADIYVDSGAAGANDGTSPANAFTSITSVGTLSAGDRVWVRRTYSETITASHTISVPNAASNPVAIVGWPISGDELYSARPAAGQSAGWDADSAAAYPTIANNTAGISFYCNCDGALWERLKWTHSGTNPTWQLLRGTGSRQLFRHCIFDGTANTTGVFAYWINLEFTARANSFEKCTFNFPATHTVVYAQGPLVLVDCDLDGGQYVFLGTVTAITCRIGATTLPSVAVVNASNTTARVLLLGCDFNGASTVFSNNSATVGYPSLAHHSDGVLDAFVAGGPCMDYEKLAAPNRSGDGGSSWSIALTPNSSVVNTDGRRIWDSDPAPGGQCYPILAGANGFPVSDSWAVHAEGGTEITLTVYVYARNWSTLPTSKELVLSATYIANATTGAMGIARSTESLVANDAWSALSVTLTPAAAGLVFLGLGLTVYEAGSPTRDVLVDPLPVAA